VYRLPRLRVKVYAGRVEEKDVDLGEGSSYYDLLASLKINPETVVIFRDGVPVAFDSPAGPGNVEVMRVVSGG
jgi:sulfur carrier protein